MNEQVFDPGRAAFDFIDDIARMADQRSVIERLDREFAKFGFDAWVITQRRSAWRNPPRPWVGGAFRAGAAWHASAVHS